MAGLRWTTEAQTWLKDIYDYIAQDNPVAAANVANGIFEKAQLLLEFPEIGYRYESSDFGDVRILLYGHYRIAYVVNNDVIDILGVFHGALDIEKYI